MKGIALEISNPELGQKYGYKKGEEVIIFTTLTDENGVLVLIRDKSKEQWLWANIEHFKPKKEEK